MGNLMTSSVNKTTRDLVLNAWQSADSTSKQQFHQTTTILAEDTPVATVSNTSAFTTLSIDVSDLVDTTAKMEASETSVNKGVSATVDDESPPILQKNSSNAADTAKTNATDVETKMTETATNATVPTSDADDTKTTATDKHDPIIDIVSVGSLTKPEFHDAQERTFGTHATVRNFFRITELNDTDETCYTNLTITQLHDIVEFCNDKQGQSYVSSLLRDKLFKPKSHIGWLCAQKRPVDGLHLALQKYKTEQLPSYLVVMDDDSYFNMNAFVETLKTNHSEEVPEVLSGCLYLYPRDIHFLFPYGGFGSIFSRKAIENLIQPIYCDASDPDGFTRMACWRLSQNNVGEKQFFREGMSVADLMYAYSTELPFTGVDHWKNGTGYCFHSDHTLGYFVGFYHIAVPDDKMIVKWNDKLRKVYGYGNLASGDEKACKKEKDNCSAQSRICHYVEPQQMDRLFAEQQS